MEKTMLAVVKEKPEKGVVLKQVPVPQPAKGELLAEVVAASICGTDVGIYEWTPWAASHVSLPIIIGHEILGRVIEINGKSSHIKVGDLVSSETHIYCQTCQQCDTNKKHICKNMQLFGINHNGSFAKYATIPIHTTWVNDPAIKQDWMSIQEPFGNAVHITTKAGIEGKDILIYGLGPTGLCAAAAAKAQGVNSVTAIDPSDYRRKLGLKMGCDQTFSKLPPNMKDSFEIVLEMAGFPASVNSAFEAVAIGGKIMAFGIPKTEVCFDWGKSIIDKEITIDSVFGRKIWETWEHSNKLLKSGLVDLDPIITHRFKLKEFEQAMEIMKSGQSGKIILKP